MTSYTLEEIARHNTENSCWLVVDRTVYDVTDFISRHPGGVFAILSKAGTDVTSQYRWHSKHAKRLWKRYIIGSVSQKRRCCTIS